MIIIYIALLIASFLFMEFVAWFSHKYVMHGFLWSWHKDHHVNDAVNYRAEKHVSKMEKNDRFFLMYAIPGILLIIAGIQFQIWEFLFMGAGISLYGFTYFALHDVLIHNRLNIPFLRKANSPYLMAIRKAHEAHHRSGTPEGFSNFGLLIFPKRYFKNE